MHTLAREWLFRQASDGYLREHGVKMTKDEASMGVIIVQLPHNSGRGNPEFASVEPGHNSTRAGLRSPGAV